VNKNSPQNSEKPYEDEPLAICHLIGGTNGIPWNVEFSEEQIRAQVAKAICVWREIQRQLKN
jgi:hypothetical protein